MQYLKEKKKHFLFCMLFFFWGIIYSFGQTPNAPIWTTVIGNSVRNIPMNSVKAEILRIADQYRFYGIEDESRSAFRARLSTEGNGPLLRTWVDNNQNFIFALQDRTNLFGISFDSASITFVKGDRVYSLNFHLNSSAFTYSVQNDRRYLEQLIDSYLSGMVSISTAPQSTAITRSVDRPTTLQNKHIGFMFGYNYVKDMPIGFTIGGFTGLYTSINFLNIFSDISYSHYPSNGFFTGETRRMGLEFTVGYSFYLRNKFLRIPIGMGMSLTEEHSLYNDHGEMRWYSSGGLDNRKFIAEAGLQLILLDFLYLTGMYRTIGFEKSSFSIGAGLIFF